MTRSCEQMARVLAEIEIEINQRFIDDELRAMEEGSCAKTASRSIVGVMTDDT